MEKKEFKRVTTTLPKEMVEYCKANKINMSGLLNQALLNAGDDCKQEFVRVNLTINADINTDGKDMAYLLRKAITEVMKGGE